MERLRTLDSAFLYLEDERAPMHIASICVFDGPVPTRAELKQRYLEKLSQFARYRQRVRFPPLLLGRPMWLDSPTFDLEDHLRWTALPAPGDEEALCTLVGRIMAQPLDHARPLWESWSVEGLAGGRWALISKVHHAMVDGVAGTGLLTALLDEQPEAPALVPPPWRPQPEPSRSALIWAAARDLRDDMRQLRRSFLHDLREPAKTARHARDLAQGLVRMARELRSAPDVSLQGPVGLHRAYAVASISLADVHKIRHALGGTVNDVVLAVLAGSYRVLLAHHGDDVTHAPIRSLIPVSVRGANASGVLDNRVAALVCELPTHLADPVARLRYVIAGMNDLKASHMAEASAWLTGLGDLAPAMAVAAATTLTARVLRHHPQRAVSTVTTHVPGPRNQLYFLGRPLRTWYPYVPITHGTAVGTAILSYQGKAWFGVTADSDRVPDVALLAHTIDTATAELVARAEAVSQTATEAVPGAPSPAPVVARETP